VIALKKIVIKKLTVDLNSNILKTIKILNDSIIKIVFVINKKNNNFIGTVTDGDIRRGLLKGININSKLSSVVYKKPIYINFVKFSPEAIKKKFSETGQEFIPILKDKKIVKIFRNIDKITLKPNKAIDNPVVIMAGGLGKRLKSLTKNSPKPLLRYNDKPLIEHIVSKASNQGAKNFFITVFYLKNKIKKYFAKRKNAEIKVNFIDEPKPLGTVGSIKYLKNIKKSFILINCDVISDINYLNILGYHNKRTDSYLTIGVKNFKYKNPYGVIKSKNSKFLSFIEKPSIDFEINAGIYVFNPRLIDIVKKNKILELNDLVDFLVKKNKRINVYPIIEDWRDFGEDIKNLKEY
jgi:dTDP-glucose pyrophosphorylase